MAAVTVEVMAAETVVAWRWRWRRWRRRWYADARFVGTWISSFGDDLPVGSDAASTRCGSRLREAITRSPGTVRWCGFTPGSTAFDHSRLRLAHGTANADEATLTLSGTSGVFTNGPIWYLRIADSRLVGMYAERDASLVVQRSGHALWYPTGAVDLNASWAAAFDDKFGTGPSFAARDRTAIATLAVSNNVISGLGSYVEQRSADAAEAFTFDVGAGTLDGTQARFSFLNFNPASGEVDWFGYHSGSVIVAAYGHLTTTARSSVLEMRRGTRPAMPRLPSSCMIGLPRLAIRRRRAICSRTMSWRCRAFR